MRLLLVDDHPIFLEGLQYLLKNYDVEVAGIATSGQEALSQAALLRPDIMLLDVMMPDFSGLDVLRLIKAQMPEIKIIMLTTSDDDQDLYDSLKYGASGYLLKSTNAHELVDMLNDLEKGELPLSPGLANRVLSDFLRKTAIDKPAQRQHPQEDSYQCELTERQSEILSLVAKGQTYRETAEVLGLSERTVKYHMGNIIDTLHLENRAQVIAYAGSMKLVDVK